MKPNVQSGLSALQIIITLAAVAVIFGLIATLSGNSNQESATQNTADTAQGESPLENMVQNIAESQTDTVTQAVDERNDMIEAQMDENEQPETAMTETSEVSADTATPGTFETYSQEKLALANDGTVVLFFHADWCPSCRGLENDINANIGQIPENTHILKLDYDTETELKRQYGVIRQHTLVEVDANGTEIKKLRGLTNTLGQVVNQL